VLLRLLPLVAIIFFTTAEARAAASSWVPPHSTMLGSNAACTRKGSSGTVKIRKSLPGHRFSYTTYRLADLRSLNNNIKKVKKQIAKARVRAQKDLLKKQLQNLKNAALKLSDCAGALDLKIGCNVVVSSPALFVLAGGNQREIALNVNSACAGSASVEIAQQPTGGSLSPLLTSILLSVAQGSGSGADHGSVRVCYLSAAGTTEGCSDNVDINFNRCTITAATASQILTEQGSINFALQGSNDCGGNKVFERVTDPNPGQVAVAASGNASYSVGYFDGTDSFQYRVCDTSGAGCGTGTVQIQVQSGPDFQGNEESLLPYRAHISEVERFHLVDKIANNRFDLIAGAGKTMDLADLVNQKFLNDDTVAPDLQGELEHIRDMGSTYGQPIASEEFIPDWRLDFPEGSTDLYKPIIPANLDLSNSANLKLASDRWHMATSRTWHTGNHRYHWGWDFMYAYFLSRSRYLSPLHAKLLQFWLGHFGTNTQVLNGYQENLVGYYVKNIEREIFGNFRYMMLGRPGVADSNGCAPLTPWQPTHGSILCDPASNLWLANDKNTGDNQNFARELMELYLMSPTDAFSNARNYSEPGDIISATSFVSGIRVDISKEVNGLPVFAARFDPNVPGWEPTPSPGPRYHDVRPRSMFSELGAAYPGIAINSQTMSPGQFVRHVLDRHPGVPRFIAGKLFSTLVYPDPSEALIAELGQKLKDLNYDLKAYLQAILTSEAMFSPRAAQKACISSPLEVYSKLINTLKLPLIPYGTTERAQAYNMVGIDWLLSAAGETLLGYPSVFTYDYCGRSAGKNGSTAWLKSYLLVFRVTTITQYLNNLAAWFYGQYDLADAMDVIRGNPEFSDGSAESFLGFFEQAFRLQLNTAERDIFMEYLTHTKNSNGSLTEVRWSPANRSFMREKIAGMIAILSVFHQSATH
jgi:hypothetical protein